MKLVLNRGHSFGLEFVLNKARLTPTKHPLRKHRKLSKVIFWLAKLAALALYKNGENLHVDVVDSSDSACYFLANIFKAPFPPSILYPFFPPSVLIPFLHPPLLLRTLVPKPDPWLSPLQSHDTDLEIQSCKVQSTQLNVHAYSTDRNIRRPLGCYASEHRNPQPTYCTCVTSHQS